LEKIEFKVRNIHCGGCVKTIQSALLSVPGVQSVEIDIPTGRVCVQGDNLNGDPLSVMMAMVAKLTELGYPRV
jgi:copper chaperone CopZ